MNTKNYIVAIVSLTVAIILTVGVLVPVIEDGTGGGNSNNGSGETRMVNDLYDICARSNITIPDKYHSYDYYTSEHTSDLTIDLDNLMALYDIPISIDSEYWLDVPLIIVSFSQGTFNTYPDWCGFTINNYGEGAAEYESIGDWSNQRGKPVDWSEFSLNLSTGAIHITDKSNTTLDGVVTEAYVISEKEDGVLPFKVKFHNDSMSTSGLEIEEEALVQIDGGVKITGEVSMNSTVGSDNGFYTGIFDENDIEFTNDSATIRGLELNDANIPPLPYTCTMDVSFSTLNGKCAYRGDITYENVDCPTEYESSAESYNLLIVGTMAYSNDSGGMSPTLTSMLSVIPLIVIVGLIVGTVEYFIRRQ